MKGGEATREAKPQTNPDVSGHLETSRVTPTPLHNPRGARFH